MIKNILKYRRNIIFILSLLSMFAMIANPEETAYAAKEALILCAGTLIPSIFPFMVAASLFINYSGGINYRLLSPFFNFLFGTSSHALCALIPGMLCGYPVGASCVCELYKNGSISKSEAESLIAYSNNSGPLFIIGAIGTGMLNSPECGLMLYIIHISVALMCGAILKPFTKSERNIIKLNVNKIKKSFTDCIADATLTILKICGFVVVFAVINALLSPFIAFLPKHFSYIVYAFLELTNASSIITESISNSKTILILLSGALGWSGMSVHMQVKSIISGTDLSMKKYYLTRFLSCIISMTISYLIFKQSSYSSKNHVEFHSHNILLIAPLAVVLIAIIADFGKKNIKKPSR